jgi:hypothetical protein
VNEALLEKIATQMFTGINAEDSLAAQKKDEIATFVTSGGVTITGSLGSFTKIHDQWKKERDKTVKTVVATSNEKRTKRGGEHDVNATILAFGGSHTLKADWEDESKDSSTTSNENQERALDEVLQAVDGHLPVAVLNVDQMRTLVTRANRATKIDIGSFVYGSKTLRHNVPLVVAGATKSDRDKWVEAKEDVIKSIKQVKDELKGAVAHHKLIEEENNTHEKRLANLRKDAAAARQIANGAAAQHQYEVNFNKQFPFGSDENRKRIAAEVGAKFGAFAGWAGALETEASGRDAELAPERKRLVEAKKRIEDKVELLKKLQGKYAVLDKLLTESDGD